MELEKIFLNEFLHGRVETKGFKIIAVTSAAAATRNQTIAARVLTQRAA